MPISERIIKDWELVGRGDTGVYISAGESGERVDDQGIRMILRLSRRISKVLQSLIRPIPFNGSWILIQSMRTVGSARVWRVDIMERIFVWLRKEIDKVSSSSLRKSKSPPGSGTVGLSEAGRC